MRLFRCTSCRQVVFFENSACIRCGKRLAFDPTTCVLRLDPFGAEALRLCHGGSPSCNWLVSEGPYVLNDGRCLGCRLTFSPPPLVGTFAFACWERLEAAKRRLLYGLLRLHLPMTGLQFMFPEQGLTGHADGVITVVLREADEVERERSRVTLHEPNRTLIGHLRHESGHFFFDRLVLNSPDISRVREIFGDERADYLPALNKYYAEGPPMNWDESFISAYAAAHPFEDWAETWANYLSIIDAVELATAYGLSLAPESSGPDGDDTIESAMAIPRTSMREDTGFEALLAVWLPLTFLVNSLNRSTGLRDWYPNFISQKVIDKMSIIHHIARKHETSTVSPNL